MKQLIKIRDVTIVKQNWIAGLLLIASPLVHAATLQVGPSAQYKLPSQAAAAAKDGDIIEIAAGLYAKDATTWDKNNLTIRAVGGRAHLDSQGVTVQDKGIWVITGKNTTVEHIEFSGAVVSDRNGAGIRQEGENLTVRDCFFHDNENGILTGASNASDILIESSEFGNNGSGDGQSHNMYIGAVRTFTLRNSYSHDAKIGHLVKSRAATNYILYNRLTDSTGGQTSYEINLPNGGVSYIIGNVIRQDENTDNSAIISSAEEGASNPQQELYVVNNTIVNDRSAGIFIKTKNPLAAEKIVNNLFVGKGSVLDADGVAKTELENNLHTNSPGFVNQSGQDYHLTAGSGAIDKGVNPGHNAAGGFSLTPEYQYHDPLQATARKMVGEALDYGAFEFGIAP